MATRGIVFPPIRIFYGENGQIIISGKRDVEEIWRYLLYWDKIGVPQPSTGGRLSSNPDWGYDLLLNEGVLVESRVELSVPPNYAGIGIMMAGVPADLFCIDGPYVALQNLNKQNDGYWALAQTGAELIVPSTHMGSDPVLEVALYNCLTSPHRDTKLEDLLDFRAKRRAELLRFRDAMDDLYVSIAEAENKQLAIIQAKEKIELSLLDLHRTLDESKIQRVAGTVKAFLNMKDSSALNILLPALGAAGAGVANMPIEHGALLGFAANAVLSFAVKRESKVDKLPDNLRDFAYLYYAEKLGSE